MSKPRRAHGAERCTVRNPGPHGARCRYQAGHDPVDDGVNGHAPELDDVTKADGSPVDFAPVGPIELRAALREERAARLKAQAERDRLLDCLTTAHTREEAVAAERDEALGLLSKAREHWRQVAWLVPALRDATYNECVLTTGTQDEHLADLAKILGTGETT